jgi:hypothetical protein
MLVNSEVHIGDLGEGFPLFAKNLLAFVFAGFVIGMSGYLYSSNEVRGDKCRNSKCCTISKNRCKILSW